MDMLGRGVYSIAEAATLTGLRTQRVNEWFRGRVGTKVFAPVFQSDYPPIGDSHSISFLDLIEVYIVGRMREYGVPLQYVRKVYKYYETQYGEHPLCTREIFVEVDRKKIFTRGLDDAERKQVVEALTGQSYFEQIIDPFLRRIDYDEVSNLAKRWRIADGIVVDPQVCFGKPTVASAGITTRVLADSYFANGQNAAAVANWFWIDEELVKAAVEFESRLAA